MLRPVEQEKRKAIPVVLGSNATIAGLPSLTGSTEGYIVVFWQRIGVQTWGLGKNLPGQSTIAVCGPDAPRMTQVRLKSEYMWTELARY